MAGPESSVILRRTEYDIHSATELLGELQALAAGKCVIDFRNVKYLDSISLGALIRRLKELREEYPATSFVLTNVRPQVAAIFKLTTLDSIFEVCQINHSG
jgi:anti-anti-sigma factor